MALCGRCKKDVEPGQPVAKGQFGFPKHAQCDERNAMLLMVDKDGFMREIGRLNSYSEGEMAVMSNMAAARGDRLEIRFLSSPEIAKILRNLSKPV